MRIAGALKALAKFVWLLADPKGFLLATTTKEEREEMGVKL